MASDPSSVAPTRAAELRAAGIKVVGALALFGALYAIYAHEVKVEEQVQELLAGPRTAQGRVGGARGELNKDSPIGWLAAEKSLSAALELQPNNPWAIGAWSDVQVFLTGAGVPGHEQLADAAIARGDAKDVQQEERFEAKALRLVQQGKASEAETYLLSMLARYGSRPRMLDALGIAQRASGKLTEAKASFKKAQDSDWRAPRKVANYAQALHEDGLYAEALASWDRALQASSEHLRSQMGKARTLAALSRSGRPSDLKAARSLIDGVLTRGPDELPQQMKGEALAVRAEVRLAQADVEGAAKDAADAVGLAPKLAAALRAKALTDAAQKKPAFEAFKAAIAADVYDSSTYFDGAAALAAAGDDAGAEKTLGSFAATLPKNGRYHLALTQLLFKKDDLKGAEAEIAKGLAVDPANAQLYFEQGRVMQKKKDLKGAVAAYERSAQLRDDSPEVYRQMGEIYLQQKATEESLRAFTGALLRYKAAKTPDAAMDAFYADVEAQVTKAGFKKIAKQWVAEAKAAK
ncbi:MAG: hypothetical protein JST92_14730 [Deltaproteobacteria bacterium]|nr:hypothetical protein [Deltaproteobacteria bacterium]